MGESVAEAQRVLQIHLHPEEGVMMTLFKKGGSCQITGQLGVILVSWHPVKAAPGPHAGADSREKVCPCSPKPPSVHAVVSLGNVTVTAF